MDSLRASLTLSSKPVGFFNDQQLNSDAYIFSCWTMMNLTDSIKILNKWPLTSLEVLTQKNYWSYHGNFVGLIFQTVSALIILLTLNNKTKQNKQTNRKSQTLLRGKTPLSLQPHEWLLLKCSDDGILYWKIFHQENVWFNPQ